jgi:hypothetical protein
LILESFNACADVAYLFLQCGFITGLIFLLVLVMELLDYIKLVRKFLIFNEESGALLARFAGHRSPIHQVSSVGNYVLTVSITEAILWNIDERKKVRILSGANYVGVDHVILVSLFYSGTVFTKWRYFGYIIQR